MLITLHRVLLSENFKSITSERILIQPYSLEISLKRNLCTWNTNYPSIDIDFNMGEFKVHCSVSRLHAKLPDI